MSYEYRLYLPGPDQPIDFEDDQIYLDIPMSGIVTEQQWMVIPLTVPVVSVYQIYSVKNIPLLD